jgi:hypothetical protein
MGVTWDPSGIEEGRAGYVIPTDSLQFLGILRIWHISCVLFRLGNLRYVEFHLLELEM